jgi:hypothetical protein
VVGWAAGLFVCYRSRRAAEVLVRGGTRVAISQAFPVLQVGAGILAMSCWNQVTGYASFTAGGLRAEVSGFGVTLITGSMLFLTAAVFGGGLRLLFVPQEVEGESAADYADLGGAPDTGRPCR